MRLTFADWSVVALYFLFNAAIGLYYKRRAGRDTREYFLSGRNVPWWLAGTSMVATTFAADTPLAVTGMVAKNGVAGNWLWWTVGAVGRARDRPVPVRDQDGDGDRAGGRGRARSGRNRCPQGSAHGERSGRGIELPPRRRLGMDADDHVLRLHLAQLVGDVVSG